ncbi:MAG: Rrf2 family transcriptional regulator [Nitrospirae bacterium]|nr:MAG: Rrf2 family transcriptional regulator [Nitrospirota bacterium]
MTKVPLKITYAILAALELALRYGSHPVQAKVIAQRQMIPVRFIEQILHALKQGGIVDSVRGAQGGYSLRKDPALISLAEIVEAVEGPREYQSPPLGGGTVHHNGHAQTFHHAMLLATIWERVRQAERDILQSITLDTLKDQYRQLVHERGLMYHI